MRGLRDPAVRLINNPIWAIAEAIGRLKACDVSQAVAPARRAEVKAADSLMSDSRALVKKLDISAEDGLLKVTKLDVRLAMFLVKKRVQGDRNFKSVAEIAQAPILLSIVVVVPCPLIVCIAAAIPERPSSKTWESPPISR